MIKDCAWASRLSPRSAAPFIATAATVRFTGRPPTAYIRLPLGDRSQGTFHEILKAENGPGSRFAGLYAGLIVLGDAPGFDVRKSFSPHGRSRICEDFNQHRMH